MPWTLIFDGDTVSLDPSIGNWSFHCQSHYLIVRGAEERIRLGRYRDRLAKERYFSGPPTDQDQDSDQPRLRGGWAQPFGATAQRQQGWINREATRQLTSVEFTGRPPRLAQWLRNANHGLDSRPVSPVLVPILVILGAALAGSARTSPDLTGCRK